MKVGFIAPNMVGRYLPRVLPMFERALAHGAGEMSLDDVEASLRAGDDYLLVAYTTDGEAVTVEAAFYVVQVEYPSARALRVVLAAGEGVDEWLDPLLEALDAGCATIGADWSEVYGRPGWARKLGDRAEHQYTVMVRKVRDGEGQRDDDHQRADPVAVGARG